jgi:sialic acid synthase SpsE
MKKIFLNSKFVAEKYEPYIIAEAGSNFDQSLNKAFKLVNIAKNSGADAIKFQLFKANKLYPNNPKMRDIFKKIELKKSFAKKIKIFCEKNKIDFMCSPFDVDSAKFLKKIGINSFKIASSEISNYSLLNYVASTKKTVLISTGMAEERDIIKILNIFKKKNNDNLIFLECTSLYPSKYKDLNLSFISKIKNKFNMLAGFSDHTLDNYSALVALGLGARVFEKHFTYNKKASGPDHSYALNPKELKTYVKKIKDLFFSIKEDKKLISREVLKSSRRNGVYIKNDLRKDSIIKKNDLIFKSPPIEILSIYKDKVIGKKLKKNKFKHEPLYYSDIKKTK